jgi:hypothetical protein
VSVPARQTLFGWQFVHAAADEDELSHQLSLSGFGLSGPSVPGARCGEISTDQRIHAGLAGSNAQ